MKTPEEILKEVCGVNYFAKFAIVYTTDAIIAMEQYAKDYHAEQVKNNIALVDVSCTFNHEIIQKIRNSQSDAEARKIIDAVINCS